MYLLCWFMANFRMGKTPETKHKNAETFLLLFVISPVEGALTQHGSDLGTASIGGAISTRSVRVSK